MATYYVPPRKHSHSEASYRSSTAAESPREHADDLQLDQSIYIFPTPSSVPPSPSGSSAFSAPTDFTDSLSSTGTGTRSRDQSFSSSGPARSRSPRHRTLTRNALALAGTQRDRTRSRARSAATDEQDLEVEFWDWTAESGEDVPDDDGLWEFEAGVERASRWDVPSHIARSLSPLRSLAGTSSGPAADFYEQHYRILLRARTQSSASSVPSGTSASLASRSVSVVAAPHPRLHIPFLSFFASLLSLNMDDPTLRLLTHSSTDSVLFPGQSHLLCDGAAPTIWTEDENDASKSSPHGILRLHCTDELALSPARVLKDGLAVACDPAVLASPFALPGLSALAGLCRFVGGVWSSSGKAWREVQDAGSLPVS